VEAIFPPTTGLTQEAALPIFFLEGVLLLSLVLLLLVLLADADANKQ